MPLCRIKRRRYERHSVARADQIQQCVNVLHLFEHLWREPAGMADTQDALVETGAALTPKQHERILRELLQRYGFGRGQRMGLRQGGKQRQLQDGLTGQDGGLKVRHHETNIGIALLDCDNGIADRRLEQPHIDARRQPPVELQHPQQTGVSGCWSTYHYQPSKLAGLGRFAAWTASAAPASRRCASRRKMRPGCVSSTRRFVRLKSVTPSSFSSKRT